MCKTDGNYTECTISHYNLQKPTCICKKQLFSQPYKNQFCEKIFEPVFPYQSKLLEDYFHSSPSRCWIGFYKDGTSFRWSSNQKNVSYTWWAFPEECTKKEGGFKFDSAYSGWILENDRALKCAICQFDVSVERASLTLQHVKGTNKILFTVDNEKSISKSYDIDLHCFTDTNEEDFKKKLYINFNNVIKINNQAIFELNGISNIPGYYWCVGFQFNTDEPVFSKPIVAYDERVGYGREYVVVVKSAECKGIDPAINDCYNTIRQVIKWDLINNYKLIESVRLTRGNYTLSDFPIFIIIHITTSKSSNSIETEYNYLNNRLQSVANVSIQISKFLSSEYCMPSTTLTSDNQELQWPLTRIGSSVIPKNKLCLDEKNSMRPVTRKCVGDFLTGANWEKVVGDCVNKTVYSETTTELFDLLNDNSTSTDTIDKLTNITKDTTDKGEIDVYLISSVMKKAIVGNDSEINSTSVTEVVSNLMNFNKETLANSQLLLNATDEVLSALDSFMDQKPASLTLSDKLIVQISEYLDDNVIGGILYAPKTNSSNFGGYKLAPLYTYTDLNSILNDSDVEIVVIAPMENFPGEIKKLSIKIFYDNNLFNEESNENQYKENKKIVSVSVDGTPGILTSPITIAFKIPENTTTKECSFWNYGLDSQLLSIHGSWMAESSSSDWSNFQKCEFYHMTHFGLLFQGQEWKASYRRFVTVFNHKQKRLLGKCIIFGWAVPFIPVLVVLSIAPDKYQLNSYGYCYVVEDYFMYGSVLPILIILFINTLIFVAIMWSIWNQKSEEYRHNKTNNKLEILLAVFLFFTLGLTWFFGIAGAVGGGIWFTYIFCLTSSIRGVILFMFFILGNKELKMLWQKKYYYYFENTSQESSSNKILNSATTSSA
ncbi:hypothetical protein FQR65_LT06115 [Abscondita terminalis]|nr:hypothetical protein FQR65_LT06115 [Abscondita terminalis]